ncbi:MAG: S41 family peptidase [Candidatus Aminicenantes bacterium]
MQHKKVRFFLLALFAAASLFFIVESGILPGGNGNSNRTAGFRVLEAAVSLIRNDYVEEPDPVQTMEGAYKGLVNSLDRVSGYLNPAAAENYVESRKNPLPETGIILYKNYGTFPIITGVRENSPAEENGLKTGDSIGAIDGESTLHMSLLEANLKLKSIQPKSIRLKLIQAEENQEITVETRLIPGRSPSLQPETGTSGILRIRNFTDRVVSEFQKNLVPRLINSQKPLILDLRNCDQGDYEAARRFLNIFISADEIGYWEDKTEENKKVECPEKAVLNRIPLHIWTNQATAGPSEMVARALKDHAPQVSIIGLPTPGLTAQIEFFLLDGQSGMILTSSVFHPSSSPPLWQKGIKPDIRMDPGDLSREAYLKTTQKAAVD